MNSQVRINQENLKLVVQEVFSFFNHVGLPCGKTQTEKDSRAPVIQTPIYVREIERKNRGEV